MRHFFPDYYPDFKCIGGTCAHNCCIGWEIDIDPDTAVFYETVSGEMGERLQKQISREGEPHFRLGEGDRCPFLNRDNLCDIILTLGEEHICEICTEHPRFHNELPGRMESGLGLCCEEAGRLILGRKAPVQLVEEKELLSAEEDCEKNFFCGEELKSERLGDSEDDDEEDWILALRDRVIEILQDRNIPIETRVQFMLQVCGESCPEREEQTSEMDTDEDTDDGQKETDTAWIPRFAEDWTGFLLELERLDETWTAVLEFLQEHAADADPAGFDRHMNGRQTEYEQFLVYLVYRHLANAYDEDDLIARAAFAAWGYRLLYAVGAAVWTETGAFSFADQVELARLFSSEIEYSEENMDCVLEELFRRQMG